MNGRVYDYNLGRFLSVDPFIHEGSQGINPYSYIMNNPLSGTDPTGYSPEKETIEVTKDTEVLQDKDGNNYVSAGDGSGDLIKVDSISVTNSNGATTSYSFSDGGNLASMNTTDINGQQQIALFDGGGQGSGAFNASSGGANQNNQNNWKENYDISNAPNNIAIGGGKSYEDLSEEQKYALHITSETLREGMRLAQSSSDRQVSSLDSSIIKAVWYSSISEKGVWNSAKPDDFARARFTSGENIQFYGDKMVSLLGGLTLGPSTRGAAERLTMGYTVTGILNRKNAFRYLVGHELGHVTYQNSRLIGSSKETNADYFYKQLYKGQ